MKFTKKIISGAKDMKCNQMTMVFFCCEGYEVFTDIGDLRAEAKLPPIFFPPFHSPLCVEGLCYRFLSNFSMYPNLIERYLHLEPMI